MKKWIRRLIILAVIGGVCVLLSVFGKKYNVTYEGGIGSFTGAKTSYRAGQQVKIYFTMVATDTDYSFYVDGEKIRVDWNSRKNGYEIAFTMPEHDVVISHSEKNSMIMKPVDEAMTPVRVLALKEQPAPAPAGSLSMAVTSVLFADFEVTVSNLTSEPAELGREFSLWIRKDGEYVEMVPEKPLAWDSDAILLPAGESAAMLFGFSHYEKLEAGDYRLVKPEGLTADFSLIEEWTE